MRKFLLLPYLSALCFTITLSGCKKDEDSPVICADKLSFIDNVDSIHRYAEQIYFWNDQIFSKDRTAIYAEYMHANKSPNYQNVLWELLSTAVDGLTGQPYEYNFRNPSVPKYSAIFSTKTDDFDATLSSSNQMMLENEFGLALYIYKEAVYVLYVDRNSPAGKAGVKRGDRVLLVNDVVINHENLNRLWNRAVDQSFVKMQVQMTTGTLREVRLQASSFIRNPVLAHKIIDWNRRKIGYFSYLIFSEENNTKRAIDPVLQSFANQNVSELIIDLRYNGGGYQKTVNYLANQICAYSNAGKVMYSEHYNQIMQSGKADILKKQIVRGVDGSPFYIGDRVATLYDINFSISANTYYFGENGTLRDIKKIYFIVSENTASASELLINSLKPYIDVELIGASMYGESTVRTYGKPLGFFDIGIADLIAYMPLYQIKNSQNEGSYFQGMTCNYSTVDDPRYDFGSINDNAISLILRGKDAKMSITKDPLPNSSPLKRGIYMLNDVKTQLIKDFTLIRFAD